MSAIRGLSEKDLRARLQDARTDLVKIRGEAGKGTIKKDSGNIRPMRRNVARIMTRLSELRLERAADLERAGARGRGGTGPGAAPGGEKSGEGDAK